MRIDFPREEVIFDISLMPLLARRRSYRQRATVAAQREEDRARAKQRDARRQR